MGVIIFPGETPHYRRLGDYVSIILPRKLIPTGLSPGSRKYITCDAYRLGSRAPGQRGRLLFFGVRDVISPWRMRRTRRNPARLDSGKFARRLRLTNLRPNIAPSAALVFGNPHPPLLGTYPGFRNARRCAPPPNNRDAPSAVIVLCYARLRWEIKRPHIPLSRIVFGRIVISKRAMVS